MIPTQEMTQYPTFGDNATKVKPDDAKYAAGFDPGDVVPAEWLNWLLNRGSSATTKLNAGALSMEQEINNVLSAGDQVPDATQTDQLVTAISYIINQVRLDEQQRPAVGVPTLWLGSKPDWALDFGNGAGTQYLWANYPKLNNDKFKDILSTLSGAGWMTAHDATGFYVPDLRGIVPIGYGGPNGKRTVETTSGGNLGAYLRSQNLSHVHDMTHYHHNGLSDCTLDKITGNVNAATSTSNPAIISLDAYTTSPYRIGDDTLYKYVATWHLSKNTSTLSGNTGSNGGAMAKPPTIAVMWIVRFE